MDGSALIRTNCVRFTSHDCVDESVKIFSNVSASHRLPKHVTDDFSWPKDAITVIKNLSEQDCAISVEILRADSGCIVLRSSRGPAKTWEAGQKGTHVLHAGEAWTLQSADAISPVGGRNV